MSVLDPESLPRHIDRLYRAAWALCGSAHDAEDLVQETFARVLARPRVLHRQDELAYLMQALRNTFLTQRRSAARRPVASSATLEDVEPADPRGGARPEAALEAQELFAKIAGLSENHRMALVAVDIVGLSYREAASVLGTREATIATRLFRAREQLAHELDPGGKPGDERPTSPRPQALDGRPTAERPPATGRRASAPQPPAGVPDRPPASPPRGAPLEGNGPQGSLAGWRSP
jgi:RNA polymerase sigma-70 factor, ECF subfamily